tara:strand:+ start:61 stop:777 length:717 start_codon:yes stop_codon:yes gene_type:complete
MITGYREQPKMGPMPKRSTTANTTRSITVRGPSQPNASLAISSPRMGPMPPSNYQPRSAPVNLTVGSKTPEALPDQNVERFSKGSFGIGKEYDKYTNMFQNAIDGGSTLEQSMYLSRTATPEDHINAFGNRDNWRKWKGTSKKGTPLGRAHASGLMGRLNSIRAKNRAKSNPFSIPNLNNEVGQIAGVGYDYGGLSGMHDIDGRGHFVTTGQLQKMKADPARFGLSPAQIKMINRIKI